ncbi:MAG: replication-associated recombination protein A [Syntrophobacteraceae bacterium]|nr:replication-associated recombination protein A [Syntrophobacteraceae bacterium]
MKSDRQNSKTTNQLNMFEKKEIVESFGEAPLAERMRPRDLADFIGQSHLLGPGKILDRLLRNNRFDSLILWGPPGCGKTTLAKIIADHTESHTIFLSAVMAGAREIRAAVEEAKDVFAKSKMRTWLLMDEIHRLNKAQQDTLLPHVENGTVLLLGATTENPSFEIIRPLLSRARVAVLEPLGEGELKKIIARALGDKAKGLGNFPARLSVDAIDYLIAGSGGDARVILNALEIAVLTTAPDAEGVRAVDLEAAKEALLRKAVHYDKAGEEHFNLMSALHKSVRGSDPDGALYWLARMVDAGEDPLYIARRIMRMASEDIGLADPAALIQAVNAFHAYHFLGSPEGELALAQAVVYLCLAPKSNSLYKAMGSAMEKAKTFGALRVPLHLRNAPTPLMKELGYGKKYQYAHDFEGGWVPENYLPEELAGTLFFEPKAGWEARFKEQLDQRRATVRDLPTGEKGPGR